MLPRYLNFGVQHDLVDVLVHLESPTNNLLTFAHVKVADHIEKLSDIRDY